MIYGLAVKILRGLGRIAPSALRQLIILPRAAFMWLNDACASWNAKGDRSAGKQCKLVEQDAKKTNGKEENLRQDSPRGAINARTDSA